MSDDGLRSLDLIAPEVAKRGYVLRSKEDIIRALITEFKAGGSYNL
jgi:hypothetical protein